MQELLLYSDENQAVDDPLRRLSALKSIKIELQFNSISVIDVRNLFDGIAQKYPSLNSRLSTSAFILKKEAFEFSVTIIQDGKEESLS